MNSNSKEDNQETQKSETPILKTSQQTTWTSYVVKTQPDEEKLFILTESLDDGVRDVLPIYAYSDVDVARYLLENANLVSMFEDRDYNNLFTYILEYIEVNIGQEFSDEESQDVLDNLTDYLTPDDLLTIIEHSTVDEKKQAGYSLYEVALPHIAIAYPEHIKP